NVNILRLINDHYRKLLELTRSSTWELKDLEKFRTSQPLQAAATVAVNYSDRDNSGLRQEVATKGLEHQLKAFVETIRAQKPCGYGFWFDVAFPQLMTTERIDELLNSKPGLSNSIYSLCLNVAGGASSDHRENVHRLTSWIF